MAIKLLLDTDIGSDIDDAVCLAYLLAQPRCQLLGITTVTGQAVERAMMASALCRLAGQRIPIFPGAESPLIVPQRQPIAQQAAALARWPHDDQFSRGEAVEFMRRTIRQHPGEITLLTIGPLTNVALLFAVDPEIPALLKALVMMCGMFGASGDKYGLLEWNDILDPHAAAIVYRARPPVHRSIGIEITTQVAMSAAEVRARFTPHLLQPVLDFAEIWFREQAEITFHDPLAAATIFDESICGFARGSVEVELENKAELGRTHWRANDGTFNHEVAVSVDRQRFFEHYFSVFG